MHSEDVIYVDIPENPCVFEYDSDDKSDEFNSELSDGIVDQVRDRIERDDDNETVIDKIEQNDLNNTYDDRMSARSEIFGGSVNISMNQSIQDVRDIINRNQNNEYMGRSGAIAIGNVLTGLNQEI